MAKLNDATWCKMSFPMFSSKTNNCRSKHHSSGQLTITIARYCKIILSGLDVPHHEISSSLGR